MRRSVGHSPRALVIQLARVGDLVQTIPVLDALHLRYPDRSIDLLCAAPLVQWAGAVFPVDHVLPWDGSRCRRWAYEWDDDPVGAMRCLEQYLDDLGNTRYEEAFNLNQHGRAVLAAHLLAEAIKGAGGDGPLATGTNPWAAYLREVARNRGLNRVHLADALCGLCGVKPTGRAVRLHRASGELPDDLEPMRQQSDYRAAVVVGAGDAERCVPAPIWTTWIQRFLSADTRTQVVLVGSGMERETAHEIQRALSSNVLSRVWDATGRTDLLQLMTILSHSRWVVGGDTGPLHVGAAVGTQAIGWYFARARVHETGPYGEGHCVFQHAGSTQPLDWPIQDSVELMLTGQRVSRSAWDLWVGHVDEWGSYFAATAGPDTAAAQRARVWRECSPSLVPVECDESF